MSVFGNIIIKARSAVNAAGKKTGTAVELSKIKLQIVQLRSQIQSTYERIGILVYEQQKIGTDNTELIEVCIKEIDALLTRINDANAAASLLKDGIKCPVCGVSNAAGERYCKKCGISLRKTDDAVSKDDIQ